MLLMRCSVKVCDCRMVQARANGRITLIPAIARATANVERAARAMGKTDVDIAVLDVDAALGYAQPMMMARGVAMDAMEMAAPVAEAGESEVSLTVRVQAVAQ